MLTARVCCAKDAGSGSQVSFAAVGHPRTIGLNGTMATELTTVRDSIGRKWHVRLINAAGYRQAHRRMVLELWQAFEHVMPYMEAVCYNEELVEAWDDVIQQYIECYTACYDVSEVTFYMHILYCQAGIFIAQYKEYGALPIWNAQSLEKSHWREKGNYLSKTNHGGGRNKMNPLLQLALLQARVLVHRITLHKCRMEKLRLRAAAKQRREARRARMLEEEEEELDAAGCESSIGDQLVDVQEMEAEAQDLADEASFLTDMAHAAAVGGDEGEDLSWLGGA